MKKIFIPLAILALALGLGLSTTTSAQEKPGDQVTITGWLTETECGAKGANAGHVDCAKKCVKEKGAKWAIYNPEDKSLWILTDQTKGPEMLGKQIKVKGTMDKAKKEVKISEWNFV